MMDGLKFPLPAFKTFLVGMPGVGKSYWGRRISAKFNLPYIDLDALVSAGEAMTIAELFEKKGEAGFRILEQQYMKRAISEAPQGTIIACGGGTPCFYNNMQLMKEAGKVIYLAASPEYLCEHIVNDSIARPLIVDSQSPLIQVKELLAARAPFYEQAHHILHAQDISLTNFEEILFHV